MAISQSDQLSRAIFVPQMTRDERQAIYIGMFDFPNGQPESTIWRKVAKLDDDVHEIGKQMEAAKQAKGRNTSYTGFGTAVVLAILRLSDIANDDCSFDVQHEPIEGEYHVHILYKFPAGKQYSDIPKSRRLELRYLLSKLFCSSIVEFKSL
jgi:hypothetical protein